MKQMQTASSALAVALAVLNVIWQSGNSVMAAEEPKEMTVLKGSITRLQVAENTRRVVVGNDKVIDARLDKDGTAVSVVGLSEGASELRIERLQGLDSVYQVFVRSDLQGMWKDVRELLSGVEGVEVKVLGDRIRISGKILTVADDLKIRRIASLYPQVFVDAGLDLKAIYGLLEAEVVRDLKEAGIDTVSATIVNEKIVLKGEAISAEERERAKVVAGLHSLNVVDLMSIQEAMIEIDVQFLQITTDKGSSYGHNVLQTLGASANAGFSGAGTGKPSLTYGVSGSASVRINALIESGSASNLMQAHLSTKSGEAGKFQSGGEDNIKVAGTSGPGDLKKVEYGVIIRVTPTLRTRDLVETRIYVEVSMPIAKSSEGLVLDKSITYEGTITCHRGESIILGGLAQSMNGRSTSRTPGLGYVPLLDLFFSQKDKKGSRRELVAVVTPRPVLPRPSSGPAYSERGNALVQGVENTK